MYIYVMLVHFFSSGRTVFLTEASLVNTPPGIGASEAGTSET